jgi:hypothetical protein
MEQLTGEGEHLILTNYQIEYQKLDQIAEIMIRMIQDYKTKLQSQLSESMVSQRTTLTEHIKAINDRRKEAESIRGALTDSVEVELKIIHDNENEYHRLQSEHYKLQL